MSSLERVAALSNDPDPLPAQPVKVIIALTSNASKKNFFNFVSPDFIRSYQGNCNARARLQNFAAMLAGSLLLSFQPVPACQLHRAKVQSFSPLKCKYLHSCAMF
jgi:hypothetical protein